MLSLTENGKPVEGNDGLYASAVYDKNAKCYIVKIVNASDAAKDVNLTFNGAKTIKNGKVTTLHADDSRATNTLDKPENVIPQTSEINVSGNAVSVTVPAKTFAVYKF